LAETGFEGLVCAESLDSLPAEKDLQARFETLDQRLNQVYRERMAKIGPERSVSLRANQRAWIKHRDEGAAFFLAGVPAAEKERCRLRFLGDVTAARVDEFNRP